MNLTRQEQETIINYNAEEQIAYIYICDPVMIRRYNKLCEKSSVITVIKSDDISREYQIPQKYIKASLPQELPDEKRQELSDRAKANFKK